MNALRIVLVIAGLAIATTGIDVGFGGIATLGWQGSATFVAATDPAAYAVHDSHVRFLGGVWLALGLAVAFAARDPRRYRAQLKMAFALVFAGGLARIGQFDAAVLFGPDIIGSLVAEIVGMPLLYLWLEDVTALDGRDSPGGTGRHADARR